MLALPIVGAVSCLGLVVNLVLVCILLSRPLGVAPVWLRGPGVLRRKARRRRSILPQVCFLLSVLWFAALLMVFWGCLLGSVSGPAFCWLLLPSRSSRALRLQWLRFVYLFPLWGFAGMGPFAHFVFQEILVYFLFYFVAYLPPGKRSARQSNSRGCLSLK